MANKEHQVFNLQKRILIMLLGFYSIFTFCISDILKIYLVFTVTQQSRWRRYCYPHFSEDEIEAQNGIRLPKVTELTGVRFPRLLDLCFWIV